MQHRPTVAACADADPMAAGRTIGSTAMTGLLRSYAASHWFGVSTPADFKAAAQAANTVDLTSFWTTHRV